MRKIGLVVAVGLAVSAAVPLSALAQAYPSKPIRLIVPSTPGGGTDTMARFIASAMSKKLGVQVVVDNRTGASGRIGSELAAQSPADGYTLLMGATTPLTTIPSFDTKLRYDPLKDFAPISLVATSQYALVVHPSLPVKSVSELIALGKRRPMQVSFSSVGTGSTSHFTCELLMQLADVKLLHVPYRGSGPATTAVLSGEVSVYFGTGSSVRRHVEAGRLRALATTGPKRASLFPDLPTVNETVPGMIVTSWYGVLAPAGTPNDILAKLHVVIAGVVGDVVVAKQIQRVGAEAISNSPEEFAAFMRTEMAKMRKVAKGAGISVE